MSEPCHHLNNESEKCTYISCPITLAFIGWISKKRRCEYKTSPGIYQTKLGGSYK